MPNSKNFKALYIIIAVVVIAVVAVFAYIIFLRPKEVIAFEGEPLEIKVQPEGELQHIPREMLFHFSITFPGVEGVVIEEDSIPKYITIDPPLRAYGKWITESTFELYFETAPLPDRKYKVKLIRLPLLTEPEEIAPQEYDFTTPPFKLLSVSLKSLEKKRAVLVLDFNFAPVLAEVENYTGIYDSRLNDIKMLDVRAEKDNPQTVLITVPVVKAPEQYKVVVKKGLPSILDVSLKKPVTNVVPIGFTTGPISVRDVRIEEAEEGYMAVFMMHSTAERKLEIREEGLENLIRIKPEISFRVAASRQEVYIFADFIPEKQYKVTLKSGIMSKKGSILPDDYTTELTIPKKKQTFQFLYQGRYLGRTGDWKIPFKVAQICTLKLNITYLPTDNVLFWHLKDWGRKESIHGLGESVISNHEIPLEKGTEEHIVWIDLKEFIPESSSGVYLVEVHGRTEDMAHVQDRMAVVISDISLVVKWYSNNIYVWAFNSSTLNPEAGVRIEARSMKNFLTGTGTTDNAGFCHIRALKEGRDPYVVFATKGDDWTYAHTPSLKLQSYDYDISGEMSTLPYLAYVYPERDLYRPGEEVHFGVVVREKYSFSGASLPVRVKIRDPRGRDYLSLSGKTDANGLAEFSFPTTPSSPTGKYMLELIAGDRWLYSTHVFVETFVPERMRVEVSIPEEFDFYKPFPLTIDAEYLFGAPAAEERYTARLHAEEILFRCPGYYNYSFGMHTFWNARRPSWHSPELTGQLDQRGKKIVQIQVDTNLVFQGPVRLTANVSVTEGGSGRVTSKTLVQTVFTRPFYIGLRSSASRLTRDVPLTVKGVLLKPDCTIHTGKTKLTYRIYQLSWSYSYRYHEDYYWDSRMRKVPITIAKEITATDGKFSFTFTPKTMRHDYLVEVVDEKHGTTSQIRIAGWGWWYREEDKIESPEVVQIRLDKETYDANEKVTAEALLPFEGKILWTVELDTIYYTNWADAQGEVATWSFRVPRGVSSVYVSALLVRSGGNYLVQRGFGIERVQIRPASLKLGLDIDVPQRIRPGDELVIKVKGSQRFKGTIAVVDEGILQITNFATPDPYERILRNLRLVMNSAESFGWIIKKFLEKTGGGLAEGMRAEEFPEARFARIVSYWSGIKESGRDGRLTYKLKIPEYNGKLRVMVLGLNEQRFGAADADVIVKSDVIVSPTIPRFMHTEDDFSFPITLINTTKEQKNANISINLKGGKIKSGQKFSVKLKPEEKRLTWIECKAGDEPGSLELAIDGTADREKYHEDFVVPLYPNVPFITESQYITINPGDKLDLKKYFADWYPRAHAAQLILSNIPALARLNHVRYAIRYPYGCIEQTSTSTLVLLRLAPLLPAIAPKITKTEYNDMVNAGIRRIMSMQTISGGFTFWPGGYDPRSWASAYALFVLLEAKSAGFVVSEGVLNAALNYLDALPEKSGFEYYVLARGGWLQKKPEIVDRLITLGRREKYDATSALWVAGAVFESGKTAEAMNLLDIAFKREPPKRRRYRGDFYSSLQLLGMRLYMAQMVNPESPKIDELVIDLATRLAAKQSYYYTTQEIAWTMLALGLYADKHAEANFTARLKLDGKETKTEKEGGVLAWSVRNAGKYGSIMLETQSENKLYLNIENTGFSKTERAFEAYTKGIRLWRTLHDYSGEKITSIQQGDLVIMKIMMKADDYYDNVAVEAAVPAGLEIENPRIGGEDLPVWAQERQRGRRMRLWHPEYVDIKDDRVIIFGAAMHDTLYYYTLARAVTPGYFFLPPSTGMVMYNPELNARTNAGEFTVYKR